MSRVRRVPTEIREAPLLEVRAEDDGRYVDLVATTYENEVFVGPFTEIMSQRVFDETLSRHAEGIKLLVQHDRGAPSAVGTPVEWRQLDTRLEVTYRFGSRKEAQDVAGRAKDGMFGGASVGFIPGNRSGDNVWSKDKKQVRRNRARLVEVSLVTVPANADARLVAVRTAGIPDELLTPRLDTARPMVERIRADHVW